MNAIPIQLDELVNELKAGSGRKTETVRTVLSWFNAQRRKPDVVHRFRVAIARLGLRTIPDFRYAYIDEPLTFFLADHDAKKTSNGLHSDSLLYAGEADKVDPGEIPEAMLETLLLREELAAPAEPVAQTYVRTSIDDPTYRIGRLAAANKPPTAVGSQDEISAAITLMIVNGYGQLPVIEKERKVFGKVTWASIAKRNILGESAALVATYIEPCSTVDANDSLSAVIDLILREGCVLVRDKTNRISGIVTTHDLSAQFSVLSEPFLLLGEIENSIRQLLSGRFEAIELRAAKNPNDASRDIRDISDLSLGECLRMIEAPEKWLRLNLNVDRVTFLNMLQRVRVIRNDVMHFDPDGLEPNDLEHLRRTVAMMQELARLGLLLRSES